MRQRLGRIAATLITGIAIASFPSASLATGGTTNYITLNGISNVNSTGSILVLPFSGSNPTSPINPDSCTNSGWYAMPQTMPGHRERFAMIYGALMSGKKVNISLYGCDSSTGYPLVVSVFANVN